ncbi:MAG: FtsH protease activity modulator HflK [Alkaliphilus sp.]|nr:FtsH protease activity modulator HflK [bacterium AH-315-G05]PHS28557.1 MAG: FtsH protease activity modulator HflK [Alkaliphilus sp.]
MSDNNDVETEDIRDQSEQGRGKKQLLGEIFKSINRKTSFVKWIALAIVLSVWFASGIYIVAPAERGIVRQFGRFASQTSPGLNFRLPWPIQTHDIVNVGAVRRAGIGFRTNQAGVHTRVDQEALMLTGDKNIADVQIMVLYQVKDPVAYLFRSENPAEILHINSEIAVRSIIGNMNIDHAMTVGRPEVEAGMWEILQKLLDDHETGLHVVGIELQVVDPPDEVREAFYDVVRAKADRERLIREAQGHALDILPRARGEAAAKLHEAEGYKSERISLAEGSAGRFLAVLEEYEKAPIVTRRRLYLEMIERVLPGVEKIIIDPQTAGGNLMQFLPLKDFMSEEGGR